MFQDNNEGGFSPLSFVFGVAVGVVATIVFATYSEDKFDVVVGKTRELGDRAGDVASDVKDRVTETAQNVGQTAKDQIKRVTGRVQDEAENARQMVG